MMFSLSEVTSFCAGEATVSEAAVGVISTINESEAKTTGIEDRDVEGRNKSFDEISELPQVLISRNRSPFFQNPSRGRTKSYSMPAAR